SRYATSPAGPKSSRTAGRRASASLRRDVAEGTSARHGERAFTSSALESSARRRPFGSAGGGDPPMKVIDKLRILADAAKYDASCASSGVRRSNGGRGLGHATGMGICHSYTPDGRCVSLLKILLT